jgi:hypothetical protein
MPLQLASPPSNAYDLIAQAISRLSVAEGASDRVTKVEDPSLLNAALPHQVYTLGSREIAQGRDLDSARLVGWRFLIDYGARTIAAVDLSCDAQGGNLRFASLETGPFAQGTRDVVAQAEQSDPVRTGSYELRVLRAPSVYTMAVWLKNQAGGDDIVIPINPGQTTAGGPASGGGAPSPQGPDDVLAAMRDAANTSLRFDSTPRPGGGAPPVIPGGGGGPPPPAAPGHTFNRQAFIQGYANMVARTWMDDTYRQLVVSNPADTLAQAGMPTIAGAVIRVLQHQITGSGKIEDQVDAWIAGNTSGLYDLFLPMVPDQFQVTPGGGAAGGDACAGGDSTCCCCPCCCCT